MTTTYEFDTPITSNDKHAGYAHVEVKIFFDGDRGEWKYSHHEVLKCDAPFVRMDEDLDETIDMITEEWGIDYANETNRLDQIEMDAAEERERDHMKYLHRNSYTW